MAGFGIKQPWRIQPQTLATLDPRLNISSFFLATTKELNLVNNATFTKSGTLAQTLSKFGRHLQTDTSNYLSTPTIASAVNWTIGIVVIPVSSSATDGAALLGTCEAPGNSTYDRAVKFASGQYTGYLYDGAQKTTAGLGTITNGVPNVITVTAGNGVMSINVDGVQGADTAVSNSGYTGYTSPEFCIGNVNTTSYSGMYTALAFKAERAWSLQERKDFAANPFSVFLPLTKNIWVPVSAGGAGTGTLAATESGSDTAAFTGDVLIDGALAATESGSDTAAFAGDVYIDGTLAATESGSDTAAFAGDVYITGTLAATEAGADVAAFGGTAAAPITGTMDATEAGSDTASFSGPLTVVSGGGGIGHGGKKKKLKKPHLWLVEIDDREIEVDDLEEIKPIVAKKLAKGKNPVVKAKPLTENPREAATTYAQQDYLTNFVPMPVYDRRLDFVNILPYIIAMQEMEDEEELLLMAA